MRRSNLWGSVGGSPDEQGPLGPLARGKPRNEPENMGCEPLDLQWTNERDVWTSGSCGGYRPKNRSFHTGKPLDQRVRPLLEGRTKRPGIDGVCEGSRQKEERMACETEPQNPQRHEFKILRIRPKR